MKRLSWVFVVGLLCAGLTYAQDDHKVEVTGDYSYFRANPGLPKYFNSQNLNGGGGQVTFFITPNIGFAADLQGYGSYTQCTKPGAVIQGCASGNLFTYMFGPQIKKHSGKYQFFGEGLFGAAHSNGYGSILRCVSSNDPTSCNLSSGNGNNNAFAMEFGGGLDIPLSKTVQIRPVEVDYLYTNFSSNHVAHIANSQNSFKYFAGVNFTLGGK